jgi:hypothetical protein
MARRGVNLALPGCSRGNFAKKKAGNLTPKAAGH